MTNLSKITAENCDILLTKEQKKYFRSMLSNTSKMPSKSISLSAKLCKIGSKLVNVIGSTCHKCYALKGMYNMPNVQNAMARRLDFFNSNYFIPIMIWLLSKKDLFRWFDSGDVQSVIMALNILTVCDSTPNCIHWIPSRESKIWADVLKIRSLPANVVLRISATMVDGKPSNAFNNTSTVNSNHNNFIGKECQAFRTFKNGVMITLKEFTNIKRKDPIKKDLGNCGTCRACWNSAIVNVSYPIH